MTDISQNICRMIPLTFQMKVFVLFTFLFSTSLAFEVNLNPTSESDRLVLKYIYCHLKSPREGEKGKKYDKGLNVF